VGARDFGWLSFAEARGRELTANVNAGMILLLRQAQGQDDDGVRTVTRVGFWLV
jgi:hypothetical protein